MNQDPWEITNLVEEASLRAVRQELTERLRRFQKELDDKEHPVKPKSVEE